MGLIILLIILLIITCVICYFTDNPEWVMAISIVGITTVFILSIFSIANIGNNYPFKEMEIRYKAIQYDISQNTYNIKDIYQYNLEIEKTKTAVGNYWIESFFDKRIAYLPLIELESSK